MSINHDQRSKLGNLSGEIVELAVGVGVGVAVSGPRWTLVDGEEVLEAQGSSTPYIAPPDLPTCLTT